MGLAASTGKDNDELVDNMIESELIRQKEVELAFRLVDRGRFFPENERETAYKDSAWKSKSGDPGKLHISAPCIYSNVVEHLNLSHGHSFLNLGSGTGYLNTVVGYLIGSSGRNHGVELHENIVNYSVDRVRETLKTDEFSAFDWCVPQFFCGNALLIDPSSFQRYDRVYCGAAVPDSHRIMLCSLLKVGGICILPFQDQLQRITRLTEDRFEVRNITSVSFADFIVPSRDDLQKDGTLRLPEITQRSLQDKCRDEIRRRIRERVLQDVPLKVRQNCTVSADEYQEPLTVAGTLTLSDRPPPFIMQQDRPTIMVHQTVPPPVVRNDDNEDEPHLMAIFDEVETDANGNAILVRPQMPHLPRIIRVMNERVMELGGLPRRDADERLPDGSARMRPFVPRGGEGQEIEIPALRMRDLPRWRDPRAFANEADREERERQRNARFQALRDQVMRSHAEVAQLRRSAPELRRRERTLAAHASTRSAEEIRFFSPGPGSSNDRDESPQAPMDIDNGVAMDSGVDNEDEFAPFEDEGPPTRGSVRVLGEVPTRHNNWGLTPSQPFHDDGREDIIEQGEPINLQNLLDHGNIRFRIEFRPAPQREREEYNRRIDALRDGIRNMRDRVLREARSMREPPANPEDVEAFNELIRRHRERQRQDQAFFNNLGFPEEMLIEEPVARPIINGDAQTLSSSSSSSAASSSSGRSSVKRPRSGSDSGRETKQVRRSPSSSGNEDDSTITERVDSDQVEVDADEDIADLDESIDSSVTSGASSSSGLSASTISGPEPEATLDVEGTRLGRDFFRDAVRPRRARRYTANRRPVESDSDQAVDTTARDQARAEQLESLREFRAKFEKYLEEVAVSQKMRRFIKYGVD